MIPRTLPGGFLIALQIALSASPAYARETKAVRLPAHASLQAAFAPWDDVEEILRNCIDEAKEQILVQAYLLTSKSIANALIAAKRRGVDVRILADARRHAEMPSSRLTTLAAAGISIWLETGYENAHNKIMIFDPGLPQANVVTGSFNFTWTAQHRNAENILVVRNDPVLAAQYEANWLRHQQSAVPFGK